jgi:electron transport complex protein RnfC
MPRSRSFPAGLLLEACKSAPLRHPIRAAPAPRVARVALDVGNGVAAEPLVSAGSRVRIGSRLGAGRDEFSLDVHSPVSGVVRSVEVMAVPGSAGSALGVVIENDHTDEHEPCEAPPAWRESPPDELLARIRDAGIAGLGGAAFPAHAKLSAARQRAVDHLVLNGAECEPWICCDDALMREKAADVVLGARVMLRASGASRCTIAIEDDKPEAIAAVTAAVASCGDTRVAVQVLPAVYPAGAERPLLAAVSGIEMPFDGLPPDAGLLCQNVGTAAAVARLVTTGEPATRRIVTVTGSGVREPANLDARLGTPISDLVAACGGYTGDPLRLIAGGTMTGRALASDEVPVTPGLNCVVVATSTDLVEHGPELPCIRCGDCASVCPPGLLPQSLLRAVAADDRDALERLGLGDCIECGCCDYVCPSRIPLTARFAAARQARRLHFDAERRAAEARERFARHERRLAEAREAERRAFEDARRLARERDRT